MQDFVKKVLDALGITSTSPEITEEEALQLINEKYAAEAVNQALADGKIKADEQEWALGLAKDSLAAFRMFAATRQKQIDWSTYRRPNGSGPIEIDEVQASINKQVGVSPEVFLKYCGPRSGNS